ncbi:CotY/CotZ family spore coat protein [Bacillus sp. FJAT-27245]|uniref:CotY/CotZ family spore coat protein n=1 Tax=Bacillus sp. FJAT-27245 TaxID=1684144 RepID=UPI0018D04B32|nr:CotY/CotZ family spore coat protein [Bacillus sp. FJAT-27245]
MADYNNKPQSPLCNILEMIIEKKEVIPFFLITPSCNIFNAVIVNDCFGTVSSPVFTIKELNRKSGCLVLTILIPIDMEGCPVDIGSDLYSLLLTSHHITLNLDVVCGIIPLPTELINRYLPIIEPKCK